METIQINERKVVREVDLVSGDITLELSKSSNEELHGKFYKASEEEEEGPGVELGGINFNVSRTIYFKPVGEVELSDADLLTCMDLTRRAFTLTE